MADNPMLNGKAFDRISIRSVLARDGEDVTQALMQAGIFDPIAVPVVLGEAADPAGGILGDGITPNLTGVLEPDEFGPGYPCHRNCRRADPIAPGSTIGRTRQRDATGGIRDAVSGAGSQAVRRNTGFRTIRKGTGRSLRLPP